MKGYVLIKIHTGEIPDVIRQMRKVGNVLEANMTFGPYDAVAIVEANDIHQLGTVIASGIQPIPGVGGTITCLAVEI